MVETSVEGMVMVEKIIDGRMVEAMRMVKMKTVEGIMVEGEGMRMVEGIIIEIARVMRQHTQTHIKMGDHLLRWSSLHHRLRKLITRVTKEKFQNPCKKVQQKG